MSRNYRSTAEPKTLAGDVTNITTQITLNNVTGLPSPPYVLALSPDTANEEIVLVVADGSLSAPTIRVQRAIETGATAYPHTNGNEVRHMIVGSDLQLVHDHLDNTTTAHGVTGAVVGTTNTQTLTQKTISGASNTFVAIPQSAVTNLVSNLADKASNAALTASSDASAAALAAHEADTTVIHGIADTSKLTRVASASAGRTIFVQSAQPTALATGDIWFQVTGL